MKRTLEFQDTPTNAPNPVAAAKAAGPSFRDETYAAPYKGIQVKFDQAIKWLRPLPAMKGSTYPWMMKFQQYKDPNGAYPAFVDPASFGLPSLFFKASGWLRKNEPACLSNRETNPNGLKLWPQTRGICWVIDEVAEEGKRLRLLNVSLYDGSRGGSTGWGYDLFMESEAVDNEPGSPTQGKKLYGDITDPENGRQFCVTKTGTGATSSYKTTIGKNRSPLNLDILTDDEMNLVCPLEKVLHIPSEEEQKAYLRAYIGEERFGKIFP